MKKVIIYISAGLFLLIVLLLSLNPFLHKAPNYVIKDSSGNIIKGNVFKGVIEWRGKKTEKLVLYFDEIDTWGVLVIIPSIEMIASSEGGKKASFKIFSSLLYQTDQGEMCTPINDKIQELVTRYSFSQSAIRFNTFEDLKRYGNEILIEKKN